MLIDISGVRQDPLDVLINGRASETRLAEGVYETGWGFDHSLERAGLLKERYPFHPLDEERPLLGDDDAAAVQYWDEYGQRPADTGVCDQWEQIVERWPEIRDSDRKFVISLCRVTKAAQPESGGWRWHKWGDYIGRFEPQCEYLHDEPEIDAVYTFHVYEVGS